jgi:hypothetical protein
MMAGICGHIGCTHVADVTMETFYVQNHEYKKKCEVTAKLHSR